MAHKVVSSFENYDSVAVKGKGEGEGEHEDMYMFEGRGGGSSIDSWLRH